ncbi:MAG: VCBS repeat-containing protein [Oligoflexia bacterium]|nr:VCBS repeat-containing protein [Oligoflexia bacterium]
MQKDLDRITLIAVIALASGCRVGGGITASPPTQAVVPIVTIPTIAVPATTPFYSQGNSVSISGMCMTGDRVILGSDGSDQQLCENSAFSFTVNRSTDGVYTFLITQEDTYQNISKPASLVWVRATSIAPPIITSPAITPFASSASSLTIAGSCETGATVSLSGDGTGSTVCVNSQFSINQPKAADGDYSIQVSQTDPASNTASTNLVWKKHALTLTPNNPMLVVNTSNVFTPSGGSGTYTLSLTTNNSGATLNTATDTYTAGVVAKATDVLKLTDSLGASTSVTITTEAGAPDHLMISASGNAQTQSIGSVLTTHPQVQVVDQFGNGVSAFELYFRVTNGDAQVLSSPVQTSDSNGYASVSMRLGYSAIVNDLEVSGFTSVLPDLAATGNANVILTEQTSNVGTGKFGSAFLVGSSPGQMILADFRGTGKQDIALVNSSDSDVGILLSNGNGVYQAMTHYSTCASPSGLVAGKFATKTNNNVDLIVTCAGSNEYSVLLGNGNGTFQTTAPYSVTGAESGPVAIVAGDFNKDGYLDFAILSSAGAGIYLGNGDGTFQAPTVDYAAGGSPSAIAAGDLNNDGYPDLVVTNSADGTVSVLINNKDGTFAPQVVTAVDGDPVALAIADVNKDGFLDVVVANTATSDVSVLLNNGSGVLDAAVNLPVGNAPDAIVVANLNGDTDPDIAVANSTDNTIELLFGAGNGTFPTSATFDVLSDPVALAAGDGNGDGNMDLYSVSEGMQEVQFLPGSGSGSFGFVSTVPTSPIAAAAADFNGDGKQDMVVVTSGANNNVKIFLGSGNGLFTLKSTLSAGNMPSAVVTADLDGDGNPDFVVANNSSSNISVFFGKGDGTFQTPVPYGVGAAPTAIAVGDFNGDGILDLAVASSTANSVRILLGSAGGTFTIKGDYTAGASPQGLVTLDLNHDGKLDLVSANGSDGSVSVLLGNGDGSFRTHVDYLAGGGTSAVAAGDFNGDGLVDVAALNSTDGSLTIFISNGDGSLKSGATYSAGTSPIGLVTGDFNGDGRLDIAITNGGGANTLSLLPGVGNGSFNILNSYPLTTTPGALVLSDFNNDQKLDFLILDSNTNAVEFWPGN